MYFSISVVNLTLGALQGGRILDNQSAPLTIDFLPLEDIRGQRIRVVTEETIVAMFQCALSPVSDEPVVASGSDPPGYCPSEAPRRVYFDPRGRSRR
jgi:hypothetical protein